MRKTTLKTREKLTIGILGLGREGKSLTKFLKRHPDYRGASIVIRDQKQGRNYLRGFPKFDIIFRSPGIPYLTPEIQAAKKHGVEISSATKLFFELLKKQSTVNSQQSPVLIGITGSKGKGTTATLLYDILKAAGKKVVLAGNIGTPMLDILPKAKRAEYVILELSSFQLQDLTVSPDIAVVVDIFPEHLDHHKDAREYYAAKSSIARFQKREDAAFYFADNPLSKRIAAPGKGKKIGIRPKENSVRKNFEMAAAVAKYLKIPEKTISKTISNFRGLEHRLELVRHLSLAPRYSNILQNVGISFINDSAGTNPEATSAAIRAFPSPLILIAGGKDKGLDYRPLGKAVLAAKNLQMVVLFGENKKKIRKAIRNSKLVISETQTLEAAVKEAYAYAKVLASSYKLQVTVLFSPASASFDQFKNYADRGEKFKKLVAKLK